MHPPEEDEDDSNKKVVVWRVDMFVLVGAWRWLMTVSDGASDSDGGWRSEWRWFEFES